MNTEFIKWRVKKLKPDMRWLCKLLLYAAVPILLLASFFFFGNGATNDTMTVLGLVQWVLIIAYGFGAFLTCILWFDTLENGLGTDTTYRSATKIFLLVSVLYVLVILYWLGIWSIPWTPEQAQSVAVSTREVTRLICNSGGCRQV